MSKEDWKNVFYFFVSLFFLFSCFGLSEYGSNRLKMLLKILNSKILKSPPRRMSVV